MNPFHPVICIPLMLHVLSSQQACRSYQVGRWCTV